MDNRCMVLMIVCAISTQLVSMQKVTIDTAEALKILALEVNPEEYEAALEKYVVNPEAVTSSVHILLQSEQVPDGAGLYVETICGFNKDMYSKLIVQIMQEYYAQEHGQMSVLDRVKVDMYRHIHQEIVQKEYEPETLKQSIDRWWGSALFGGVFALLFGLADLVIGLKSAASINQ
jgi:hypothetical protein